jgi:hypothetical protein
VDIDFTSLDVKEWAVGRVRLLWVKETRNKAQMRSAMPGNRALAWRESNGWWWSWLTVPVTNKKRKKQKQKQKRTLTEKGQGGVGGHLHDRLHYDLPTFASIVDIDFALLDVVEWAVVRVRL